MPGPFNFQAELASLQSKQKLAEAMRSAAMTGQLRTGGGLGGLAGAGPCHHAPAMAGTLVAGAMAHAAGRAEAGIGAVADRCLKRGQPGDKPAGISARHTAPASLESGAGGSL